MTPKKGPRKASHCAYDLHYHFVFVVKYRRALLRPEIEAELVRLSYEIAQRYELEIESIGADNTHIHLLCSAHPKTSPGDIARIYKSITAIQLFKSFPDLRKELRAAVSGPVVIMSQALVYAAAGKHWCAILQTRAKNRKP